MLYVESEHPVTGLDTAISPGITTPVPGRVSNAGKRQEPRNTRTFQAVGAVTKSVGELDNVRYVRREIGVAKFPRSNKSTASKKRNHGRSILRARGSGANANTKQPPQPFGKKQIQDLGHHLRLCRRSTPHHRFYLVVCRQLPRMAFPHVLTIYDLGIHDGRRFHPYGR